MAVSANHLLQSNFKMAMTGATIDFSQSYHPTKNNLLLTETKETKQVMKINVITLQFID